MLCGLGLLVSPGYVIADLKDVLTEVSKEEKKRTGF
jgi:hypothetical protein